MPKAPSDETILGAVSTTMDGHTSAKGNGESEASMSEGQSMVQADNLRGNLALSAGLPALLPLPQPIARYPGRVWDLYTSATQARH